MLGIDKAVSLRYQISHCILTLRYEQNHSVTAPGKLIVRTRLHRPDFLKIPPLFPQSIMDEYFEDSSTAWYFTSVNNCLFQILSSFHPNSQDELYT